MVHHLVEPAAAGDEPHGRLAMTKQLSAIRAKAAYYEGIAVEPSRDERGRRTLILTKGAWTREVAVEDLADAFAELQELRGGAAA